MGSRERIELPMIDLQGELASLAPDFAPRVSEGIAKTDREIGIRSLSGAPSAPDRVAPAMIDLQGELASLARG